MARNKQEIPLSFKVSDAMSAAITRECEIESRSISEMTKILLAEALVTRESKRNIHKIL